MLYILDYVTGALYLHQLDESEKDKPLEDVITSLGFSLSSVEYMYSNEFYMRTI